MVFTWVSRSSTWGAGSFLLYMIFFSRYSFGFKPRLTDFKLWLYLDSGFNAFGCFGATGVIGVIVVAEELEIETAGGWLVPVINFLNQNLNELWSKILPSTYLRMLLSLRYKLSLYIQLLVQSGSIFDSTMPLSSRPSGVSISCIFFSTNFL